MTDKTSESASNAESSADSKQSSMQAPQGQGRKLLLDMGPLIVFFIANYFTGEFMLAVGVLVAATVVALAAGWILERRISMMALFGCVAVSFFGGLSLYFDNELFMGAQLRMHDAGWRALSRLWVAMFLTTALANEIAWRTLSTDDWVTFKVFGITVISLAFAFGSMPIMTKHQIQE